MRRILAIGLLIVAGCAGSVGAQAPALINDEYRFPFWSDGDVGGPGPFHYGYRTGFVITNPNDELMTIELVLYDFDGGITNFPLSDGQGRQWLVRPHATINITTPAAWQSPQRFGQVRANGNFPFLITVQVELVRIQDPAIAPENLDPRISVIRMEASRTPATVFISWERSATSGTVMATGVVFRTVQDPIVMPAAIASQ